MILVSDKDEEMRAMLTAQLLEAGLECQPVAHPRDVRAMLRDHSVRVWVTDSVFPEAKIEELIREVHQSAPSVQILVLTRAGESEAEFSEVTRLIEAGATDFLVKPFDRSTLVAKVRVLYRRMGQPLADSEQTMSLGDLVLNPKNFDVYCGTERTPLTPSEFKLLHALMLQQGAVLSRDQLIGIVQGAGIVVVDRAVDTHVASLRKKLGPCGAFIETVRGVGYRIRSS